MRPRATPFVRDRESAVRFVLTSLRNFWWPVSGSAAHGGGQVLAKQKRHLSKRSTGSVPYLWLALIGVFVLAVVVAAFSSAMPKGTTDAPAAASKNPEPRVTTESAPASTPKVTPPATPAPAPTLPEQMAHVPASTRQLIVITGRKLGSNAGTLEVYNKDGQRWVRALSVPADFGKSGLVDGLKRRQGHLQTPT